MIIEATQFLRPNGEKKIVTGVVSDEFRPHWEAVRAAGLALELEILGETDLVSITLTDAPRGDYTTRIVPNDMDVVRTVEDMIKHVDLDDLREWRMCWDADAEASFLDDEDEAAEGVAAAWYDNGNDDED